MILLSRKKILFFCFITMMFVLFYLSFFSNQKKAISTSSTPVSNHTIILDAGHGFPDGGAVSENGTIESEINLKVVQKLQNLLESSNCTVILTRSDGNGIYEQSAETIRQKKISDMKNRAEIANTSNAEIFISVHMNKLSESKYSGWQSFYKNTDEESKKLADYIQKNLNFFIEKNNTREIKSISNIYLTNHVDIPLVIIECGFLSNMQETELLKTDDYQNLLAWSIYTGILDYFN